MGTYFVLKLKGVSHGEEDLVTDLCFSHGAQGISENLQFSQESLKYEPVTLSTPCHQIEVYFNSRPEENLLVQIARDYSHIQWDVREEQEKDWLEEWKKDFKPFCLAGDWWVVPSWCEAPSAAPLIIRIDPGMAFGTGTHETTQLAAGLLAGLDLRQKRILDVGTGTGVLAIAAAFGGAKVVDATEIDSTARQVARENIEINGLDNKIDVHNEQIQMLGGVYDVVVANIIDGILVELRRELTQKMAPSGYLILSGILSEREEGFVDEFAWNSQGLQQVARVNKGEWVGFLLQRV